MKPVQKPEWMALADSDKSMTPRQITRGLPILAVAITVAIIGAGSIFAQPQELSVANAESISVATTQNSPEVDSSDSAESNNVSDATQNAMNPSIAFLSTKSQDDDDTDDEGIADDDDTDHAGIADDDDTDHAGIADDDDTDHEGIDD